MKILSSNRESDTCLHFRSKEKYIPLNHTKDIARDGTEEFSAEGILVVPVTLHFTGGGRFFDALPLVVLTPPGPTAVIVTRAFFTVAVSPATARFQPLLLAFAKAAHAYSADAAANVRARSL
jgi:hypothetical protein